jgi:hypothetical protein
MLHACFYTICLVFRYTSWCFYAISGTNLLTSRHSASSLFSAIFVFQKSYIGNILRIRRNKSRTSRNSPKLLENRRGDGVGPRGPHKIGWRSLAPGRAHYVWGHPGSPLTMHLRLYKASGRKTLEESAIFKKEFRSSAAATDKFWGTEVSVPAPCRDGECPWSHLHRPPSPSPPYPSTWPPSLSTLLSPMMRRE